MREVVSVFVFHPLQWAQMLPKVSCLQELGRRLLSLLCTCEISLKRCRLTLPHTREATLTGSSSLLTVAGNSHHSEQSTPSTSQPEAAHDTEPCSPPPVPSPGWRPATAQEGTHVSSHQLCDRRDIPCSRWTGWIPQCTARMRQPSVPAFHTSVTLGGGCQDPHHACTHTHIHIHPCLSVNCSATR